MNPLKDTFEYISQLVFRKLKPAIDWVVDHSTPSRFVVFVLAVFIIGFSIKNPRTVLASYEMAESAAIVAYHGLMDYDKLPLGEDEWNALRKSAGNFRAQLESMLVRDGPDSKSINEWALGQILTAINQKSVYEMPWTRSFFYKDMQPSSHAWLEIQDLNCIVGSDGEAATIHFPATFWATFALHNMGEDVTPQIKTILDHQSPQGYWTTYDLGSGSDKNASTYSTTLAALLLHYTMTNARLSLELKEEMRERLRLAMIWLQKSSAEGTPWLWHDYPNNESEATLSIASSAMVIHLFNVVDVKLAENLNIATLSREFLRNLPTVEISPLAKEVPGIMIFDSRGRPVYKDSVRYYVLPWLLMAIKDSYRHGDISERVAAKNFLELHVANLNQYERTINVAGQPWIAAEYLIGLNYLRGEELYTNHVNQMN
jgi:hypothetical protein